MEIASLLAGALIALSLLYLVGWRPRRGETARTLAARVSGLEVEVGRLAVEVARLDACTVQWHDDGWRPGLLPGQTIDELLEG